MLSGCSLLGLPNSVIGAMLTAALGRNGVILLSTGQTRTEHLSLSTNDGEFWVNESNISNLHYLICKMEVTYFTPFKG